MASGARQHSFHDDQEVDLPMNQGLDLAAEWRVYAVRRGIAFLLLFGWVPFCVGAFYASRLRLHLPGTALLLMALWFGAMCAAIWWAGEFRCPRCRRRYGALGYNKRAGMIWRGLFNSICANCKLRKFEDA